MVTYYFFNQDMKRQKVEENVVEIWRNRESPEKEILIKDLIRNHHEKLKDLTKTD